MATKHEKDLILGYDISIPEQKEKLIKHLSDEYNAGKSMKEALQVPEHQLENIYTVAFHKYQRGEYKQAEDLFRYLLAFDEHCYKYLLGLAASLHRQKEYASAARVYQLASLSCPVDPVPFYHAADCFLHTGDLDSALIGLDLTIRIGTANDKYTHMKERAQLIKDNIIKAQKEPGAKKDS